MSQSLSPRHTISSLFLLAIATMCMMSTGCSTFSSMTGTALPVDAAAKNAPRGSYSVEMHPNIGAPKQYKGELVAGETVSEALKKAGAIKKFRSMDVEVLRVVESNGKSRGLRMPVSYDPTLKGPTPEQDYALLDGDRIVVKPEQNGTLVRMLSTMMSTH